jgi:hypothetical protein
MLPYLLQDRIVALFLDSVCRLISAYHLPVRVGYYLIPLSPSSHGGGAAGTTVRLVENWCPNVRGSTYSLSEIVNHTLGVIRQWWTY